MIYFVVFVDDTTGEIRVAQIDRGDLNPPEGIDPSSGYRVIYIRFPINDLGTFINLKYWDGEEFADRVEKPNQYATWSGTAWTWDSANVLNDIRVERNNRLYMCDWTQVVDAPLMPAQITQWRTYRQSLRDLPDSLDPVPDNVSSVVWPTEPS